MKTRLLLTLPVAAALLAATVISSPAADGAATKACPTADLVAVAHVPGNGAAGSVYYKVELTNLSGSTCAVSGYPKVSAVDLNGKPIGAAATKTPAKKMPTVTLKQGQSAAVTVQIVEALNYPPAKCKATWAAGLRIVLPGSSGSTLARLPFEACALTSSQILSVGPVTAS
jgi:Protein of unknown function (DUF4232)